jgi:exodeoxyribonuclease V beta subunit
MEFYFPINTNKKNIKRVFNKYGSDIPGNFPDQIEKLELAPIKGFMKGFIDMVFEFKGKYYLLDWKSNYLGKKTADYHRTKLDETMRSRYYFLQYHIYCLALHQYLQNRLPGYLYDRHFGGMFYIFLRGVDRHRGPGYGIFYDLPDSSLITRLSTNLLAVKS